MALFRFLGIPDPNLTIPSRAISIANREVIGDNQRWPYKKYSWRNGIKQVATLATMAWQQPHTVSPLTLHWITLRLFKTSEQMADCHLVLLTHTVQQEIFEFADCHFVLLADTVQREIFQWCKFSHTRTHVYRYRNCTKIRTFFPEMTRLPDSFWYGKYSHGAPDVPIKRVGAYHPLDGERGMRRESKSSDQLNMRPMGRGLNGKFENQNFQILF